MAELVDAPGSGSGGRTPVRVQIPLAAIFFFFFIHAIMIRGFTIRFPYKYMEGRSLRPVTGKSGL